MPELECCHSLDLRSGHRSRSAALGRMVTPGPEETTTDLVRPPWHFTYQLWILKFLWQFCFEQYRRTLQFYGLGMYRNLEQLLKMELWPCDSCVDSLSSDFSFSPRIHASSGFSLWHHPACLPCPASGTQFPLGALHRHLSLLEGLFPPSSLASPVSPG